MLQGSEMSEEDDPDEAVDRDEFDEPFDSEGPTGGDQVALTHLETEVERLEDELYRVRGELARFEKAVEDRTVDKPALEGELRRYVRQRMRRSRARGWGPYLVLLYGTVMTVGAFYFLAGVWAILAMFVVWLSTLGLYVVMLGVGAILTITGAPMRAWDAISGWRSRR